MKRLMKNIMVRKLVGVIVELMKIIHEVIMVVWLLVKLESWIRKAKKYIEC